MMVMDEEERIRQVFEKRLMEEPIDATDWLYLAAYEHLVAQGKTPDWYPRILHLEDKLGKKIPRRDWRLDNL